MKILQVSHRVPYPLNEGGTIGIYNYTRGFSEQGHQVTLLCINGIKHNIDLKRAEAELSKYCDFKVCNLDTNVKLLPAFFNLFTAESYNTSRFYSREFEKLLTETLKDQTFDIVQVEGTFVAMYYELIKKNTSAPIILRQHNVEFQIWERLATNQKNPLKKWYLNLLARRLKKFETEYSKKFDAVVPVTNSDAELFKNLGCDCPIYVSPAGIDTQYWKPIPNNENPFFIFHLGSLEWLPNQEAVLWFIHTIWPGIYKTDTRFQFYVAGKNMPDSFKNLNTEGVHMMGEVEDGAMFIQDKAITVVPLLSGSGIRLKILEAMSAGKLVISTDIGAQGIEFTNKQNILIANTREDFLQIFKEISENPKVYNEIRNQGHKLIQERYSNNAVVSRLIEFYTGFIK